MSTDSENEEKLEEEVEEQFFELFPNLPPEIRLFIVEKLRIKDRFRFARCSQGSWNIWARITKNEPCSIIVYASEDEVTLTIKHYSKEKVVGFTLFFEKLPDEQMIRYENLDHDELWKVKVDSSFDVIQLGANHIKKAVKFYQNSVKNLYIDGKTLRDKLSFEDDAIENLRIIESLTVYDDIDNLRSLLSKIRHPLKKLAAYETLHHSTVEICEQIFQVHGELHWPHTIFDNETFLRLSAKRVFIDVGALTEQNICDFINSWRNGPLSDQIDEFDWNLRDSKFDKNLLCQLLGEDPSLLSDGIVIEHEQGFDKAEIRYRRETLTFSVICYGDWTDDDYEDNYIYIEEEEDESVDFEYEYEHEYGYFEDELEDFEDEDYNYEDNED